MRWWRSRRTEPAKIRDQASAIPGDVLAAYAAASERAKAAERERARLRKLVDQVPDGVWGGWRKSFGTSARIVDLDRVRELLMALGVEVPMKDGAPRLVVSRVGSD